MADKNKIIKSEIKKLTKKSEGLTRKTLEQNKKLIRKTRRNLIADYGEVKQSDWNIGNLKKLNQTAKKNVDKLTSELSDQIAAAQAQAWDLGKEFVDNPLNKINITVPANKEIWKKLKKEKFSALENLSTELIKNLGDDALKNINSQLSLGLVGEKAPFEIMEGIQKELGDPTIFRAERITRTELTRAQNMTTQERHEQAAKEVPGLKKQWIWSGVSRVDHAAIDGQVRDVDEPFDVGGEQLMYPTDPAGSPEQTINCSCDSVPYKDDWEK